MHFWRHLSGVSLRKPFAIQRRWLALRLGKDHVESRTTERVSDRGCPSGASAAAPNFVWDKIDTSA